VKSTTEKQQKKKKLEKFICRLKMTSAKQNLIHISSLHM